MVEGSIKVNFTADKAIRIFDGFIDFADENIVRTFGETYIDFDEEARLEMLLLIKKILEEE